MTQHKVPSKSCPSVSGLSFSAPLVWDTHLFICAFWVSVDMWAVLFVALLLQVWTAVTGYPSGAPVGRCEDMTPQHSVQPQSIPSPYTIAISNITFSTNQTINGNLKRCDFFYFIYYSTKNASDLFTEERGDWETGYVTSSVRGT